MKRWGWAALMAVMWGVGCGEGGSLPTDKQSQQPATTNPDGTVDLPDIPVTQNPNEGKTETPPSLWPLTKGSTWRYRITDPKYGGTFEKQVEVLGTQTVPETTMTATAVRSTQPFLKLEELSWQVDLNGVVVRLREEDRESGTLARVMTWSPATVKGLAREQPVAWRFESKITEATRYLTGTKEDETKEKIYVWTVEAVNETVTTPAGTFTNAIRLKRTRSDKESKDRTYWLVPGIGKVKEDGERQEVLLSYDVKKP
jgi:hypothetical protein